MSTHIRLLALTALFATGCALLPPPQEEGGGPPQSTADFAELVRESIQENRWQTLLAASDPLLYEEQVVDSGVPEIRYLVRLLGLDGADNTIQEGDELEWADLDRITLATLAPVGQDTTPRRFTGLATVESGEQLRLDVWVTRVQGRFVLTGRP